MIFHNCKFQILLQYLFESQSQSVSKEELTYLSVFISDPGSDFFPSRIRMFSIPDPHQKNLSIFTPKMVSQLSEIWSGLFIPDPDPDFLHIPDPGSRGQKGTGSWIRIRNNAIFFSRMVPRVG